MNLDKLKAELKSDEGVKSRPYRDTVNKLTIGVGRNLDDVGLYPDEIDMLLVNDINRARAVLSVNLPWFVGLSDARQNVLINMCFNLGWGRLSGFKSMLTALENGQYEVAAKEMLNSKWSAQVGQRARRLSQQMRNDIFRDMT